MLFRFAHLSFGTELDGIECVTSGEFDAGEYTDVLKWLSSLALSFPNDADDETEPINVPPPGYTSIRSSSYGWEICLNNAWRSPALTAYAAEPNDANLRAVKAVAKNVLFACDEDTKKITISPDTFSCAWATTDDHGYGGAIIITSKLSKEEAQAKIKADMDRVLAQTDI